MRLKHYDDKPAPSGKDMPPVSTGKSSVSAEKFSKGKQTHQCERMQSRLIAYLDGELTDQERQAVQAHLDGCSICQNEMTVLQSSEQMLMQAQQTLPLAGDLRAGFYARLEEENRLSRRRPIGKFDWRVAVPALAACGLIIGMLDGRFHVPTSSSAVSTSTVAVAAPLQNHVASMSPKADVLKRSDLLRMTAETPKWPGASLQRHTKITIAQYLDSTDKRFGFKLSARTKAPQALKLALRNKTGYWRRSIADAASTTRKSTTWQLGLALPDSAILKVPDTETGLAYTPLRSMKANGTEPITDTATLTAKINSANIIKGLGEATTRGEVLQKSIASEYYYDANNMNRRAAGLGVLGRDAPDKFGRVSSLTAGISESGISEDDGVNFQVRDSRRGFTSEMRLASQVHVQDGRQVLTIHLEDNDVPVSKTDSN